MRLKKKIDYTKIFKKDYQKLLKGGKANLKKADMLIEVIVSGKRPVPSKWKDHALLGNLKGYREAHFGGDWLILYVETKDEIIFQRIGTHNQLFASHY